MKTRLNINKKVEVLTKKRRVVSSNGLLNLIEKKPEKIAKIKFLTPKLGSNSLGKFMVEYEW